MTTNTPDNLSWFDLKNYDVSLYIQGAYNDSPTFKILMRHFGTLLGIRHQISLYGDHPAKAEIFQYRNPLLRTVRADNTTSNFKTAPPFDEFILGLRDIVPSNNSSRFSRIINPLDSYILEDIFVRLPNIIDEGSEDINKQYQKVNPNKNILISIDLRANKKSILDEIEKFIDKQKDEYECFPAHQRKNDQSPEALFRLFIDHNILAYIDLKIQMPNLAKSELGKILFERFDSSTDIKKINTLDEYSKRALDPNVYDNLFLQ